MAELQLSIKHSPIQQRVSFWSMCALAPVWSLIAPLALGGIIALAISSSTAANSIFCPLIILFLLGIMVSGIVGTALAEDDTIYATKSGIAFPILLFLQTRFHRNKEWNDLIAADLIEKGNKQVLELAFRDNSRVSLQRHDMQNAELEQLLLAIELWGTSCQRSPNLIEFQRSLQTATLNANIGYTRIWEEELGRRFSTTAFMPLEPGQQLRDGRLKVVRQLAFGGLSAIYLVETEASELAVLKEAVIPSTTDEETVKAATARLEREFKTLTSLKHPNITAVQDYFVENDRNYLMLHYVNGQDLRQLVKQHGPRSEKEVREWGITLVSVLSYLHNHEPPILHRDFTPDNVVLQNDGQLVVIDFGAANEFIGQATGTLIGKQAYIAPEQLRGKAQPSSDIYALGASLYFLLTGRDPKPLAVAHPKSVMPEISTELDDLVATCTAFEPNMRFSSADEVHEALIDLPIDVTPEPVS
jgi:tRNA A-37 threonylcarbamoyl transferase component Bud32